MRPEPIRTMLRVSLAHHDVELWFVYSVRFPAHFRNPVTLTWTEPWSGHFRDGQSDSRRCPPFLGV